MTALEQQEARGPDPEERVDALLRDLGAQRDGLGAREADRRLRQYGPNEIRRLERPSRVRELARELVDPLALLLLTDVPRVVAGWGSATAVELDHATPTQLRELTFAAGSMGPKIDAACRFVERTGGLAAIGALDDAEAILAGRAGTQIRAELATAGAAA